MKAMANHIEHWALGRLVPNPRNPRTHSDAQIAQIAGSILAFGFNAPILVDAKGSIIAGHGRYLAALKLGLETAPVIILDHLSEIEKRAYLLADNKLAELSDWDDEALASELAALKSADIHLGDLGFSDDELRLLMADAELPDTDSNEEEAIPELPAEPVTRAGDIWLIGKHRLICGDCRDRDVVHRLLDGVRANLVITSPPYAAQREYDASSGFTPISPEKYSEWFRTVADNIAAILAKGGSYFLNIKEHSQDGERSLYVKDLVIAHQRKWGWRFVDEFCWRNTANGVPGKWPNRLKNAWEPIFHFSRNKDIKFRPKAAGHESDDVVVYSPDNPSAPSGSGLLGCGADKIAGIAWPSNVVEAKAEGGQGSHSAPFPRALVEFFVKAFSDTGDAVCDPFTGSGTSIAAAHILGRVGYGIEISPAYCDVALRRLMALMQEQPALQDTGQAFAEVATSRGVPSDPAMSTMQRKRG
jgi:DNA modification methylase